MAEPTTVTPEGQALADAYVAELRVRRDDTARRIQHLTNEMAWLNQAIAAFDAMSAAATLDEGGKNG